MIGSFRSKYKKDLFNSKFSFHLPHKFFYLIKSCNPIKKADVDIVITSYNQLKVAQKVIENYSYYENNLKLNFIIIDNSFNILRYVFFKVQNVSFTKIFLFPFYLKKKSKIPISLKGSTSLAVSMQIGLIYSNAKYIFTSHSDMCTLKKNFFSLLQDIYLKNKTDIVSCTQRHILPFMCGGAFFKKEILKMGFDWLPDYEGDHIDLIDSNLYKNSFENYRWLDVGEKFCFYSFNNKRLSFLILDSRGTKESLYQHPLERYNLLNFIIKNKKIHNFKYFVDKNIESKKINFLEEMKSNPMWRKTIYNNEVIFLHAGRGSRKFLFSRGNFELFLNKINVRKIYK